MEVPVRNPSVFVHRLEVETGVGKADDSTTAIMLNDVVNVDFLAVAILVVSSWHDDALVERYRISDNLGMLIRSLVLYQIGKALAVVENDPVDIEHDAEVFCPCPES